MDIPYSARLSDAIRERELYHFDLAISDARKVAEHDAKIGRDEGTCVLGAGVAVDVLPRGCRRPQRRIVISAPFQGNIGSLNACRRALALLIIAGLDAYWYDGVMD
jgi:hypothetical protein